MKILCLDFDGVIHSYTSGWQGAEVVTDGPVPGALEFLVKAVERFEVHIFSSRSNQPGGIHAMQSWLVDHLEEYGVMTTVDGATRFVDTHLKWPTEKPPAFLTIDDRAVTFEGEWPSLDWIDGFVPWNRRGSQG